MKLKDHNNKIVAGIIGTVVVGIGITATVLTGGAAAIGFLAVAAVMAGAMGVVADVQDFKAKQVREKKPYDLGFIKPLKALWKKRLKNEDPKPQGPAQDMRYNTNPPKEDLPIIKAPNDEEARELSKEIEALFNQSQHHHAEPTNMPLPSVVDSSSKKYTPLRDKDKEQAHEKKPKKNLIHRVFSGSKKSNRQSR